MSFVPFHIRTCYLEKFGVICRYSFSTLKSLLWVSVVQEFLRLWFKSKCDPYSDKVQNFHHLLELLEPNV